MSRYRRFAKETTRRVLLVFVVAFAVAPLRAGAESQAVGLFRASEVDYREGRFQAAVDKLVTARGLVNNPVLTYNLARAYEGLGDLAHAADEYERYLSESGNVTDSGSIRTRVAGMRRSLGNQRDSEERRRAAEATAQRAEAEKREAQTENTRLAREARATGGPGSVGRIAAWSVLAAGLATSVGGATCAGLARQQHELSTSPTRSQVAAEEADHTSRRYALATNIALPVGAAIAVAGAVWVGVNELRHRNTEHRTRAGLAVMASGMSSSW